ncbi:3-methyl-2-oxobutanoate hydroxymethyltransferase [hydrothermal vent metagenome]|uniref:3-methyl-2-oxobutanoate hydroxymethyltransferase n=1 Tax=hydrothermal vent metagenome TaxID=652676 RepID=A0A3B0Y0P2_9ZZZZ
MSGYATNNNRSAVTIPTLHNYKRDSEKFSVLTAYDASFAAVLDTAGVEVILVGDSLGMVIQGHSTTIPVTMNDMLYHTACVSRVCQTSMVMADMPFMSYVNPAMAVDNARRLLQEGGASMVKIEGGEQQVGIVKALTEQGVPVCAHLGLRPQSVYKMGGFKVQGRDPQSAQQMLKDALSLALAGADLLLLECVPASLAKQITKEISIPVIGIGAGRDTDAQVLVLQDVLGITYGKVPRFSQNFMQGCESVQAAIESYVLAVKSRQFPTEKHSFT